MFSRRTPVLFKLFLCMVSAGSLAMAQPAKRGEFPVGRPQALDELPASRFQTELKQLAPYARERAHEWLRGIHFTEGDLPSMHTDAAGGICFACHFSKPVATGEAATAEEAPGVSAAAVPVSPFPASLVFSSRPGSVNVLYINFVGETVTGTQWNTTTRPSIPATAFSTDADFTTFSDAEQAAIKRVWQRMAEDFAPFDINVTTQRPASFTSRTAMVLITRKNAADGVLNPFGGSGGVAYVNVFGRSDFADYRPAWVYSDNLGSSETNTAEANIAEAASHEIGHNLGLSHDGTSTLEYYDGHGSDDISWGPLMGTGYNRNVSQWSKGDYLSASNTEDDLGTIAAKLTYRPDDRGDTRGTATPLIITNTINIVSTTPETDPANSNSSNKGVIENQADVDVYSFVTGSGSVLLTVSPWISPASTRGGNLDISLELYNDAGVLVTTSNPPDQTSATISTNLAEGRYYLYVKSSAAGNPGVSPLTGYVRYGSIGQYFISGSISPTTGFVAPPVAEFTATNLTQSGQNTKPFTVTYSDDAAINVATLDSNDIRVTGPGGYDQLAQLISVNSTTNGTPRTATYAVTPAGGGAWLPAQNGTYTVVMRANQVADIEGAFVAADQLGQFQIAVPAAVYSANMSTNPGWTLEPEWEYGPPAYSGNSNGPPNAFTGTQIIGYNLNGDYPTGISVKYATTPPINPSGSTVLTLRFRRWLGVRHNATANIQASKDGVNWVNIWTSAGANISDSAWQLVQYPVPASVLGGSSLRLRWGLSSGGRPTAIGWNIDDVEILGDGALDTSPPAATLSVGNITLGGSPSHSCSVTFTDATAVRRSTLDSADLLVTGPNGYSSAAEFIGANPTTDGSPLIGAYSIPAPGGSWDATHNGIYTITLLEGAVEDTLNNATPATTLGTFNVSISMASPGALAVTPAGNISASGNVGGAFTPESALYTLTNTGGTPITWTAGKTQAWVTLDATSGTLDANTSTTVSVSINDNADALIAGNYSDTVSFTNTSNGTGNATRSVILEVTAPLRFTSVGRTEAGVFEMVIHGPAGRAVVVEASVDFMTWPPMTSGQIGPDGTLTISDPQSATLPARFYRVRTGP